MCRMLAMKCLLVSVNGGFDVEDVSIDVPVGVHRCKF